MLFKPHPFIILQVVEVPAVAVDRVVDTTGAGDAFLGGIISGNIIFNDVIMISLTFTYAI